MSNENPQRFERTGEFRIPKEGEWYEFSDNQRESRPVIAQNNIKENFWILRPLPDAPEKVREWPCGHVYKDADGQWMFFKGVGKVCIYEINDFVSCPICGARRPSAPETITEQKDQNWEQIAASRLRDCNKALDLINDLQRERDRLQSALAAEVEKREAVEKQLETSRAAVAHYREAQMVMYRAKSDEFRCRAISKDGYRCELLQEHCNHLGKTTGGLEFWFSALPLPQTPPEQPTPPERNALACDGCGEITPVEDLQLDAREEVELCPKCRKACEEDEGKANAGCAAPGSKLLERLAKWVKICEAQARSGLAYNQAAHCKGEGIEQAREMVIAALPAIQEEARREGWEKATQFIETYYDKTQEGWIVASVLANVLRKQGPPKS